MIGKMIVGGLAGLVLLAAAPVPAEAVVCAKGVVRAGCAGPNGAVVVRKPVAPATTCRWINGTRICKRYW